MHQASRADLVYARHVCSGCQGICSKQNSLPGTSIIVNYHISALHASTLSKVVLQYLPRAGPWKVVHDDLQQASSPLPACPSNGDMQSPAHEAVQMLQEIQIIYRPRYLNEHANVGREISAHEQTQSTHHAVPAQL